MTGEKISRIKKMAHDCNSRHLLRSLHNQRHVQTNIIAVYKASSIPIPYLCFTYAIYLLLFDYSIKIKI